MQRKIVGSVEAICTPKGRSVGATCRCAGIEMVDDHVNNCSKIQQPTTNNFYTHMLYLRSMGVNIMWEVNASLTTRRLMKTREMGEGHSHEEQSGGLQSSNARKCTYRKALH